MARDYYEVLGVPRTADAAQIQQAFRTLARRYHPDVNKDPAAEDRFKELNEAYSVLSDPDTRARYDRFGPDFRQIPEDYDERAAAAQGFGEGAGTPGRVAEGARGSGRREGSTTRPTSTSRSSSAVSSVAERARPAERVPGRSPAPTRRPNSRSPWKRPTGAADGRSPSTGRAAGAAMT